MRCDRRLMNVSQKLNFRLTFADLVALTVSYGEVGQSYRKRFNHRVICHRFRNNSHFGGDRGRCGVRVGTGEEPRIRTEQSRGDPRECQRAGESAVPQKRVVHRAK